MSVSVLTRRVPNVSYLAIDTQLINELYTEASDAAYAQLKHELKQAKRSLVVVFDFYNYLNNMLETFTHSTRISQEIDGLNTLLLELQNISHLSNRLTTSVDVDKQAKFGDILLATVRQYNTKLAEVMEALTAATAPQSAAPVLLTPPTSQAARDFNKVQTVHTEFPQMHVTMSPKDIDLINSGRPFRFCDETYRGELKKNHIAAGDWEVLSQGEVIVVVKEVIHIEDNKRAYVTIYLTHSSAE